VGNALDVLFVGLCEHKLPLRHKALPDHRQPAGGGRSPALRGAERPSKRLPCRKQMIDGFKRYCHAAVYRMPVL